VKKLFGNRSNYIMKEKIKKHILWTYQTFINFIFPAFCLSCKKEGFLLCSTCASKIKRSDYKKKNWINPLFDYKDETIKKAIWKLKYREKTALAKPLACLLYEHIIDELADANIFKTMEKPMLIAIPLSKKRMRERGYNQSLLISKEMSFIKNSPFELRKDVLYKIKDSENQADIKDRLKRMKNLKGCFCVKNKKVIHNRNIVLIDDVVTTGATLTEARKVLKKAGAKKVIAFTLAH